MLIVIGASGRGKSTICNQLAEGRRVISAGRWARERLELFHHGADDPCRRRRRTGTGEARPSVEALSSFAQVELNKDVDIAIRYVRAQMGANREQCIVEGLRNPRDLMALLQPRDHILDLGGEGTSEFERTGLAAIRACRPFLTTQLRVTWSDYARHFATLPEPIPMHVDAEVLRGSAARGETVAGRLLAFESYAGAPVTACWQSQAGGAFHDVLLSALYSPSYRTPPDEALAYWKKHPILPDSPSAHSYALAGKGAPMVELSTLRGPVAMFARNRVWVGTGEVTWMLHWPEDNLLLHVVIYEGRLFLWPPHKLMGDVGARALPEWKKAAQ